MFIPSAIIVSAPVISSKNPALRKFHTGEYEYLNGLILQSSRTSKYCTELKLHFAPQELGVDLDINDNLPGQLHLMLCACAHETTYAATFLVSLLGLKIDFSVKDPEGKTALMLLFAKRRIPVLLCQQIFDLLLEAKIRISPEELAVLERRATEREVDTAIELLNIAKQHNAKFESGASASEPAVKRAKPMNRTQMLANEDSSEAALTLAGLLEAEHGKILTLQRMMDAHIAALDATTKLLTQLQNGNPGSLVKSFGIAQKLQQNQDLREELMDKFEIAQHRYASIDNKLAELAGSPTGILAFSSAAKSSSSSSSAAAEGATTTTTTSSSRLRNYPGCA